MGKNLSQKITVNQRVLQGTALRPLILVKRQRFSANHGSENNAVHFADETSIICKFDSSKNY